jgi:hypothetical protein
MITFLVMLWISSAVILITSHLTISLLIDGHLHLGLWTKIALTLFSILGPVGLILEIVLLLQVIFDILKSSFTQIDSKNKKSKPSFKSILNPKTSIP